MRRTGAVGSVRFSTRQTANRISLLGRQRAVELTKRLTDEESSRRLSRARRNITNETRHLQVACSRVYDTAVWGRVRVISSSGLITSPQRAGAVQSRFSHRQVRVRTRTS